jgi:hypothetical protein
MGRLSLNALHSTGGTSQYAGARSQAEPVGPPGPSLGPAHRRRDGNIDQRQRRLGCSSMEPHEPPMPSQSDSRESTAEEVAAEDENVLESQTSAEMHVYEDRDAPGSGEDALLGHELAPDRSSLPPAAGPLVEPAATSSSPSAAVADGGSEEQSSAADAAGGQEAESSAAGGGPAASAAPRVNRHGAARRAKRPRPELNASHIAGVFADVPERGASGVVNHGRADSNRSKWVSKFRARWQKEQVNERFLLRKPPSDGLQEPQGAWRAAAKMVRRSDQVLRHWHHQGKRQRLDAASDQASAGNGSSILLGRVERLELSSDEEGENRSRRPFQAAAVYPTTEDEDESEGGGSDSDNSDDDDDSSSLRSPPSQEDGVSSPYIVPNHGHLPEGLSWNAFQKNFKGYPNSAVAKQWQQYQQDGGRWMTGRVGGWDSGVIASMVQPYRSSGVSGRSSSSHSRRRKSTENGGAGGDMQSNGGVGVAGDGYIPIPGSRGSKKTGPWTPAEDALLNQLVKEYGLQEGSIKQQPMGTLAGAAGTAPEEPSGWAQVRRKRLPLLHRHFVILKTTISLPR